MKFNASCCSPLAPRLSMRAKGRMRVRQHESTIRKAEIRSVDCEGSFRFAADRPRYRRSGLVFRGCHYSRELAFRIIEVPPQLGSARSALRPLCNVRLATAASCRNGTTRVGHGGTGRLGNRRKAWSTPLVVRKFARLPWRISSRFFYNKLSAGDLGLNTAKA